MDPLAVSAYGAEQALPLIGTGTGVHFQMFSARRTVDLKARRVELNQGLDLDLRLENLVITGACLSSRKDRVVL